MWETNDEKTKLARVVVNFDRVLDDAFKINISKQIVQLPQSLQAEVKRLADVARKASQQKYRKAKPAPTPSATSPIGGSVPSTADGTHFPTHPNGSLTAAHGGDTPPAALAPRIAVKDVATDKFIWKLSTGITGSVDLQVSELNSDLAGLIKQIRDDDLAVEQLAKFLRKLDDLGIQALLLGRKEA